MNRRQRVILLFVLGVSLLAILFLGILPVLTPERIPDARKCGPWPWQRRCTPTPTLTKTPTFTPTYTSTPTPTLTPTFTPTPTPSPTGTQTSTPVPAPQGLFALAFFGVPNPIDPICEYAAISIPGRVILSEPNFLAVAHTCGTKVLVFLSSSTENVVGVSGGLDLGRYRAQLLRYVGVIDFYVDNGTIVTHLTVDEPHDCVNDWKSVCPSAQTVDQAGAISREYWPTLPTAVNTLPNYLRRYSDYVWQYTDTLIAGYAYHKYDGDPYAFAADVTGEAWRFSSLMWSMNGTKGGCQIYDTCAMTPDQVRDVATAQCSTRPGIVVGLNSYDPAFLTTEMLQAIEDVRTICNVR